MKPVKKIFVIVLFSALLLSCAQKTFYRDGRISSYSNIFVANPRIAKYDEIKDSSYGPLKQIDAPTLVWIKLSPDDKSALSNDLKQLVSMTKYTSCAYILYVKLVADDYEDYLTIDTCGDVFTSRGFYKGIPTEYWIEMNNKYF